MAAIPLNWTIKFDSLYDENGSYGIVVRDEWESDSGDVSDLSKVDITEKVQPGVGTGVFMGYMSVNSDYLPATSFTTDRHTTPKDRLKSPGGMVVISQVSIFKDTRTGSKNIPVTNSGYTVTRRIFSMADGTWILQTMKAGANVTANGYASNAGAGGPVDRTQP